MNRNKFTSSKGKEVSARMARYKEACRVFNEFETLRKSLQSMGVIFGEVEDIINKALVDMPEYDLVYRFSDGTDSTKAFEHMGEKFSIRFVLRENNTTLVSSRITLKIDEVFELTQKDLIVRIRKQLKFQR
jgi:hypothetical protein